MTVSDNDKCMILKAFFDFRATPTCHKTTRPDPTRPGPTRPGPTVRPKNDGKNRQILVFYEKKRDFWNLSQKLTDSCCKQAENIAKFYATFPALLALW